jgi:uncharacterized damage-inducible protein DinB
LTPAAAGQHPPAMPPADPDPSDPTTPTPRTDPPFGSSERPALREWLDYHRATLELKCAGLDREGLIARPVASSLLSLHGLVRHMAEVERSWFRRVLEGQDAPPLYYDDEHPDGDFEFIEDADWRADLATWHAECDAARAIEAAAPSLEVTGTSRRGSTVDLRWIMIHMIEEYARHNGHADLLRELVDGSVGD